MGHRALVAVAAADDRYDLYHSQWGARDWRLVRRFAPGGVDPAAGGQVRRTPLATDRPLEAVVAGLDYQVYEALFVAERSGAVRPYLVCWFGLPGVDDARPGDGAVIGVDADAPETDGEYLRGWFAGLKEAVLAVTERGGFAPAAARAFLAARVDAWRDVRRVHFGPDAAPPG